MNASILPLLLVPAALIAAAATPLDTAATRELAEVEELFGPGLLTEAARYDGAQAEVYEAYSKECTDTIAHYRRTGDARHASPARHLTLLHLACLARKPALVQHLLAAGADPNALIYIPEWEREYDGCFTLCLCDKLWPHLPAADKDSCLRIINMLVAAGGDAKGRQAGSSLYMLPILFANVEGAEDIALHLLALGTNPANNSVDDDSEQDDEDDDSPDEPELPADQAYLGSFISWSASLGWTRVVEQMLQSGRYTDIDAPYNHFTLLGDLVQTMVRHPRKGPDAAREFESRAACIALLLRHGASPDARDSFWDKGATVADYIHSCPELADYLAERGITLPHSPRELREQSLVADLTAMPLYACPPTESLAPLQDALTALLADARANQEKVLRLLMQLDPARTAAQVAQLPLWQPGYNRTKAEQELVQSLYQFRVLTRTLPSNWLVSTAEKLEAAGQARDAHSLIILLGLQPEAAPLVEKLCADSRPALASAAWTARLRLAGLDNLPLLDPRRINGQDSENYEQLRRLRHALDLLTDMEADDSEQNFFLNFSQMDNLCSLFFLFTNSVQPRLSDEECLEELTRFLRSRGARAEANYLGELHALHSRLHPRSRNDLVQAGREWLAALGREKREARFAELTRPEQAEPAAFTVEALIGQHVWELYHKNKQ